jgi:drug/metabolite transporter (DMT)-like permease
METVRPRGGGKPSPGALRVALSALVLIWGSTWAAIRIGLEGVPPFTGASLRFGLAAAVLLLAGPWFGLKFTRSRAERRIWLWNGLLMFTVSYGVVYWAEQWVPSGLAAVLFATFPFFVAIEAHFLLHGERLTRVSLAGILAGFAGVATIYSEDFELLGGRRVAIASAVMLASPIASSIANVLVKRWGAGIHPFSVTVVPMLIGTTCLGTAAGTLERDVAMRFDAASVGSILYLAIFGTAVTFGLYFWLLSHFPASKLALIAYCTPVVAVFVGTAFLGEPLTARFLAGSAAVVAGVAIAGRARQVPAPVRASPEP